MTFSRTWPPSTKNTRNGKTQMSLSDVEPNDATGLPLPGVAGASNDEDVDDAAEQTCVTRGFGPGGRESFGVSSGHRPPAGGDNENIHAHTRP